MATRSFINGFETGNPGAVPNTSDITVQTSVVRSGTYALRVNGQPSKSTYVKYPISGGDYVIRSFFRGYLRISQLPSTKRAIARWGTTGGSSAYLALFLLPDGKLGLGERNNVLATSTTALALDTWYCVEVAYHCHGNVPINLGQLRIDGQTEIDACDLLTVGSGPSNGAADLYLGALDTAASALVLYWDDLAIDLDQWPGPGRVDRLLLTSVARQTSGYVLQGDAPDIVTALNTTNDNAWVTEPNVDGHELIFAHEPVASDVSQVRGITLWKRWRSSSATHYGQTRQVYQGLALTYRSSSIGSTYTWLPTTISRNPLHSQLRRDEIDQTQIGVASYGVGNPGYISALVIEVDCDVRPGAKIDPYREFIASCDTGNLHEFTGGNVVPSTARVRTGTYSLRANSLSGASDAVAVEYMVTGADKVAYHRFYLFFEMLPPEGEWVQIFFQGSSWFEVHRSFAVRLRGDGAIQLVDRSTTSGWYPSPVQRGRWIRFEVLTRFPYGSVPGRLAVRIDGQLIAEKNDCETFGNGFGGDLILVGCHTKSVSSFPIDIYIDDIVVDSADWPGTSKLLDLMPSGPGAITGIGWNSGPVTGQPRWQQIRETPADDAGSYIISNTTTSDIETYAIADLPFQSVAVTTVRALVRVRSWPLSSNVYFNYGIRANNRTSSWYGTSIATTTWTNHTTLLRTHPTFGQWTVGLINGAELQLRTNTSSRAFAITNARLTVEYLEAVTQGADLVADAYIAGAYRKKELKATGYVEDVSITYKQLRGRAIVVNETPPAVVANRWYVTNASPTYAMGPAMGDWDVTNYAIGRKLSSTKAGIASYRVATKRMMGEQRVLMIKAISDPLVAQRIDGSLRLTFAVAAGSTGQMTYHVHVWVSQGDSAAVRGVLIDNWTSDEIWPSSTIGVATIDAENITPVDVQDGDRLIVEIGYFDRSTSLTYGLIWYGGTASTDLTDGSTDVRQPGHIDLEGSLQKDPDQPSSVESGAEVTGTALLFGPVTKDIQGTAAVQGISIRSLTADACVLVAGNQRDVTGSAVVAIPRQLDIAADAVVFGVRQSDLTADAAVAITTTYDATADALIIASQIYDVAADALTTASQTYDATADALIIASQTYDVAADALTMVSQLATVAGDAVVRATIEIDLVGGSVVQAEQKSEIAADAVVVSLGTTQELDLVSTGLVSHTAVHQLDASSVVQAEIAVAVNADGVVFGTQTTDLASDAVCQAPTQSDLVGEAILLATGTVEVLTDALCLAEDTVSCSSDALVSGLRDHTCTADALCQAPSWHDLAGDGIVLATETAALTSDAVCAATLTQSILSDALVRDTNHAEITAEAAVLAEGYTELSSSAVIFATVTYSVDADTIVTSLTFGLNVRSRVIDQIIARPRVPRRLYWVPD